MTHPLESGQHPLTDEIIDQIADDLGIFSAEDCMRAAADWQLEADAEWWKIILNKAEFLPPHAVDYIVEEFKRSMRPQDES